MAKIGFEYIAAAELDEEVSKSLATAAYKNGREIGPGASVTGTPATSDVKDYGDDRVVETDVAVTGGTLNMELNEATMEKEAFMLGHEYKKETGEMVRNANDIPPYLGVGLVGKSKRSSKVVFRAKIYLKAQFKEPSDENQTKQENVTFSHTSLEGNMYTLENGDWKTEAEFTTLDEAKAYVNKYLRPDLLLQVPALSQSLGDKNAGKTVEEMIESDVSLKWTGKKADVTGTIKKIEDLGSLYGDDEKTGHFFPVEFDRMYYDKEVVLSGRKAGDKVITPSAEDPYLIIRIENFNGTATAKVKDTGELIFELNFAEAKLAEEV